MIKNVENDVWFDNEKLSLVVGADSLREYRSEMDSYEDVTYVEDADYQPNIIYLSATSCNLKCKYCYAEEGTYNLKDGIRAFRLETYIESYEKLKKKFGGINTISFFGGEPLLNFPTIKKFIEYLYDNYNAEEIPNLAINTNMTIMNDEIINTIKKYRITIGTSMDGPKDINDTYRVGRGIESVFDLTEKNLDKIKNVDVLKVIQFTISRRHVENYVKGQIVYWVKKIQELPIGAYEIIPVESDDPEIMIDLSDEKIKHNYEQLCSDLADYYISEICYEHELNSSRLFMGIITRIMKRAYQEDCNAGRAVTVTPTGEIYPCHMFAGREECAIQLNNLDKSPGYIVHEKFKTVRNTTREHIPQCQNCLARKVCGVWCKGFSYMKDESMGYVCTQRCTMIDIIIRKIIHFLAWDYDQYEDTVVANIINYHNIWQS